MGIKSPAASCTALLGSSTEMSVETSKGRAKGGCALPGAPHPGGFPAGAHTAWEPKRSLRGALLLGIGSPHAVVPLTKQKAGFLMAQCFPRVVHKPRIGSRSHDPLAWTFSSGAGLNPKDEASSLSGPNKGPWRRAISVGVKGTGPRCGFKSRLCHLSGYVTLGRCPHPPIPTLGPRFPPL